MTPQPVNGDLEAFVELNLRGPGGTETTRALLDTGFTGFLSLPPARIKSLGLGWLRFQTAETADAKSLLVPIFAAEVESNGGWRRIEVAEIESGPLMGVQLLRDNNLSIDFVEGGRIAITPLAGSRT